MFINNSTNLTAVSIMGLFPVTSLSTEWALRDSLTWPAAIFGALREDLGLGATKRYAFENCLNMR